MSEASSTATTGRWYPADIASPSSPLVIQQQSFSARGRIQRGEKSDKIGLAVFSYIQAVRALGRTNVNTSEIADGLKLSVEIVEQAVAGLKSKGVKFSR